MSKLLIIDDDLEMLKLVQIALSKDGHMVTTCSQANQLTIQECRYYDLILLDMMMPEMDGLTFLKMVRDQLDCPILFLTAKSAQADLIRGLGLGADDYIRKPFSLAELRARVQAHLRRQRRQISHAFNHSGIFFDMQAKQASINHSPLPFTKSEYAICEFLVLHAGQVFTKEQIYESVFGYEANGDASAIAEHIKNIRAKLKKNGLQPIETFWGIGYKWQKDT